MSLREKESKKGLERDLYIARGGEESNQRGCMHGEYEEILNLMTLHWHQITEN